MPEPGPYPPGSFCWVESGTDDPAAARAFYGAVFGWEYEVADETGYLMCLRRGRPVAGLYPLDEAMQRLGAMPYWLAYVAVADADATLAAVGRAGGRAIGPVVAVPGLGRGGSFFDPAGGLCGVWQAEGHPGAGLTGEHGALSWVELQVRRPEAVAGFYCSVFGWALETVPVPGGAYYLFKDGEASRAGMVAVPPEAGEVPAAWAVYFHVDDAEAAVAAALEAGGEPVSPLMPIDSWGRFATLRSADGAAFSILEASPIDGAPDDGP